MSLIHTWEAPLLHRALEAAGALTSGSRSGEIDPGTLGRALDACERLTAAHSRSFYFSSALLPREKRQAVRALYAFCRITDDLVDNPAGSDHEAGIRQQLEDWKREIFTNLPRQSHPVAIAWGDVRARYRVPVRFAEQLIDGVLTDLGKTRYQTFDELAGYAYGVASTVGLMSMHIIGFSGPEAVPYAIKLGVALQVTNILRDVAEDWANGRLYLPLDELAAFGLGEADIAAGRVDDRWRAFMRFQIARNRRLYDEAWPGIACLSSDGRFAIAAAADLYRAILQDIEAHDYDVFNRRAYISGWEKLRRLPAIWRASRPGFRPRPA